MVLVYRKEKHRKVQRRKKNLNLTWYPLKDYFTRITKFLFYLKLVERTELNWRSCWTSDVNLERRFIPKLCLQKLNWRSWWTSDVNPERRFIPKLSLQRQKKVMEKYGGWVGTHGFLFHFMSLNSQSLIPQMGNCSIKIRGYFWCFLKLSTRTFRWKTKEQYWKRSKLLNQTSKRND